MSKSLFLLKRREDYSADPSYSGSYQIATGMWNSAKFVVDELNSAGRDADLAMVIDANGIDAAVMSYNPTHVFIEGLWVTPAKFVELMGLSRHAGRTWVVRVHSEIPFISGESIAMEWIAEYLRIGVVVAPNAPRAAEQLQWQRDHLVPPAVSSIVYLPNCYPQVFDPIVPKIESTFIDIGCFGAFRPLKNQLQQAFAALRFAENIGKTLRFHVNSRLDAAGVQPYRNVQGLMASVGAILVEHPWEERNVFLESLRDLDVLLQVSMSETFNIVAADATLVGTPILTSSELPWVYPVHADPQSVDDIVKKLQMVYAQRSFFVTRNRVGLQSYARESKRRWTQYLPASA